MRRPTGTIELLAREIAAEVFGSDFVDWAVRALVEGFDSQSLRRLAGLDGASVFEARAMFDRAASELALDLPSSRESILREYLLVVARQIVDRQLEPADALDTIHTRVLGQLLHPSDLMPWCYIWEGLDPETFRSLTDAERYDAARSLAKRTLDDVL